MRSAESAESTAAFGAIQAIQTEFQAAKQKVGMRAEVEDAIWSVDRHAKDVRKDSEGARSSTPTCNTCGDDERESLRGPLGRICHLPYVTLSMSMLMTMSMSKIYYDVNV